MCLLKDPLSPLHGLPGTSVSTVTPRPPDASRCRRTQRALADRFLLQPSSLIASLSPLRASPRKARSDCRRKSTLRRARRPRYSSTSKYRSSHPSDSPSFEPLMVWLSPFTRHPRPSEGVASWRRPPDDLPQPEQFQTPRHLPPSHNSFLSEGNQPQHAARHFTPHADDSEREREGAFSRFTPQVFDMQQPHAMDSQNRINPGTFSAHHGGPTPFHNLRRPGRAAGKRSPCANPPHPDRADILERPHSPVLTSSAGTSASSRRFPPIRQPARHAQALAARHLCVPGDRVAGS